MTGTSKPTPAPTPGPTPLLTRLHQAEQSATHWKAMSRKHEDRAKEGHAKTQLIQELRAEISALKATLKTKRNPHREPLEATPQNPNKESDKNND